MYKALLAMTEQQNFQVKRWEYLEKAMALYGTYSIKSTDEIVYAINQFHIFFSKQKWHKIAGDRQSYLYKDNVQIGKLLI